MKRYLIFFGIAGLLHLLLLFPLVDWFQERMATVGGGSGATIHIAISSRPVAKTNGLQAAPAAPSSRAQHGHDRRQAAQAGEGRGTSKGLASGVGSSRQGDDDTLAQIRALIEAAKRYPLMARRRGLEGTSSVAFRIQADGSIANLKLVHSSGNPLLDEAAIQTIQRAAPFPTYPETIQIGIRFALQKSADM